jgi:hypothetical protein
MNRMSLRTGTAVLTGIAVLAGASGALAISSTMPAASPVGGNTGNQLQFAVPAAKLMQTKALSYFYMSVRPRTRRVLLDRRPSPSRPRRVRPLSRVWPLSRGATSAR